MKSKSKQEPKTSPKRRLIVSDEIDKIEEDLFKVFVNGKTKEEKNRETTVKLKRTRRETRLFFTFKGGLEDTESRLQKVYKALTKVK